jgi:putative addiction module component (TIGR02574 family)
VSRPEASSKTHPVRGHGGALDVRELEAQTLRLSSGERAHLAAVLLASLHDEDEIAAAWAETADRRYEELRSGAVAGVPAEEVLARIRASLE